MSYESRAYDKPTDFGPEPVVVLVVTGTHDVSRLIGLFARGNSEQIEVGKKLSRKVRAHNGGRAALALLSRHGGPDFTREQIGCRPEHPCETCLDAALGVAGDGDDCLGLFVPYDVEAAVRLAMELREDGAS